MKQFPIGCWTYHMLEEAYPNEIKDWYDLGLTNPLTPSYGPESSKEAMLAFLDECDKYGMKVFMNDYRGIWRVLTKQGEEAYRAGMQQAIADFGSHPAVKGFYVGDEPDAPDAADAFAACRIMRELAPELCPYLNLLPWFDWIGERMGTDAYAPYLDRCVKEGNVTMLAYDCYTQMWDGDSGWDVYFDNLREHSEAATRNGVEFCSTLLSCGHYEYRCPNIDDFRWQVSTAAAFGAKSIAWFFVYLPFPHANYRQAAINSFRERTSTFEWLSSANRLFQTQFGELMLDLTIEDIAFTEKAYGGKLFQPTEEILGLDNNKGTPMLCNRFCDKDGKKYWVIVNLDPVKNVTANFHLAPEKKLALYNYGHKWQPIAAITDAVGQAAYGKGASVSSVILAPGQMEVVTLL